MTVPSKVDGFAGSNETRKRFVRLYASEALVKGDAVAIDTATTTYGSGNHVKKADSGEAGFKIVLGVAAEAIASGEIGSIQVAGVCDFAKLLDTGDALGDVLHSSGTAGSMTLIAADNAVPAAIILAEGTANTADSTVLLLNCCAY